MYRPGLENEQHHRIAGVLMHEAGHIYLLYAKGDHTEKQADDAARAMFGAPVRYDRAAVQSSMFGRPKRPAGLPH